MEFLSERIELKFVVFDFLLQEYLSGFT